MKLNVHWKLLKTDSFVKIVLLLLLLLLFQITETTLLYDQLLYVLPPLFYKKLHEPDHNYLFSKFHQILRKTIYFQRDGQVDAVTEGKGIITDKHDYTVATTYNLYVIYYQENKINVDEYTFPYVLNTADPNIYEILTLLC